MQGILHLKPNDLATLGYTDLSLISEHESYLYYRAYTHDDRSVLIKVPALNRPPVSILRQLEHEFEIARDLNPDYVIRPIKIERSDNQVFLLMEDCTYPPLTRSLHAPLSVDTFLTVAIGITEALAAVHGQGVMHGNIKPDNIFADSNGGVKLTGFGIASVNTRKPHTAASFAVLSSSPAYMSPEQTGRMNRSIDYRSDLYALGVSFYRMLTGQLPFNASDPMEWTHCHIALQPIPPCKRVDTIPKPLSDIILKLLEKSANERYQTARGLKFDLQLCDAEWRAHGTITPFPLGSHDVPDHLLIPEKLYGRDNEVAMLLDGFNRVVASGKPELLLVSGYSGVGKSAVMSELHKALLDSQALYAEGKFDQYMHDSPYATLAQALRSLINQILGGSEAEVEAWRGAIQKAVDPNGRLITELVPELEALIGRQPEVRDVPAQDARNRFNRTFRRILNAFARPLQPLVLFLDDLQWLDDATLNLLEHLITHPDVRHLLLLGAYRDNAVGPEHPLRLMLDTLRQAGAAVQEIRLAPLKAEDLQRLVIDSFHCDRAGAEPLVRLIFEKTGGNPFFTIQFLTELADGGLVTFDELTSQWHWDLDRIHVKGFTDNVTDLMVAKLKRLGAQTQASLKQLACLGNKASLQTLALIQDIQEKAAEDHLQAAVTTGLLLRQGETYAFLHDRVQEAAYALVPDKDRTAVHLQIGRRLLTHTAPENLNERLFDIVNQLNQGAALIRDPAEKAQLAELNAAAGRKARTSIAYTTSRDYFAAAANLCEDAWDRYYDFLFALYLDWAEIEYLIGAFEDAEKLFSMLTARAAGNIDKAAVCALRVAVYPIAGRYDEALAVGIEGLQLLGETIPMDDKRLNRAIETESAELKKNLRGRKIAELVDGAEATDPKVRMVTELISRMGGPAYIGSTPQVFPLLVLKGVNSALRHGLTKTTCNSFSGFSVLQASIYKDVDAASEYAKAAIRLCERFDDIAQMGDALYIYGNHVNHLLNPYATDFPILQRGFDACLDSGNLVFANYIAYSIVWQAVERGDRLEEALEFSRSYVDFAFASRNIAIHQSIVLEQQFMKCLMGETDGETSFSDDTVNELACVGKIADASFTCGVTYYHIMKMLAAYLMGDSDLAQYHAAEAENQLAAVLSQPMEATFYFLHALILVRIYPMHGPESQKTIKAILAEHNKRLTDWAENCPANFAAKHLLVAAEIAAIEADELSAERLFDQAAQAARQEGFVHWEAMAYEAAARFQAGRGFTIASRAYLREARYAYARWGAEAKVKQLEASNPWIADENAEAPSSTDPRTVQLDVMAIIKAQHAISREIEQERLSETLLRIVMENAGAEKGYLYVVPDSELFAVAGNDGQIVYQREFPSASSGMAQSILNYVKRTRAPVLLTDARTDAGDFANDDYLRQARTRSVLCLPILRQERLAGVVYLENNQTSGAFTSDNLAVLEALASQAAISLENARTYRALQQSEARYRQLFETANEGIWILDENSGTVFANDRMCEMMGCEPYELSGRSFTEFLFEENIPDHKRKMEERSKGVSDIYERRMRRKDGTEAWMLVSTTPIYYDDGRFHGSLAMLTDITERKQAEQRLATSERLFRTLAENAPINIARYDKEGRLRYINPRLANHFPLPFDQVEGLRPEEMPADIDSFQKALSHTLESGEESSYELEVPGIDGGIEIHFVTMVAERDESGEIVGVLSTGQDISRLKQAENRLRLAASVFASSQEGILISDAENRIIDVNPAFTSLTGYSREEVIGKNPSILSAGRQGPEFYAEMWQSINSRGEWQGELWNRRKSGEVFAEQLSIVAVRDEQGRLLHFVGAFTDISPIKQHQADLDRIAHYDMLTSVPNRRLFGDRLEQAIARVRRHGKSLAVCYLDLDGFKPINDQFGHEGGDRMLVEIARRLESISRADDTVARLGGDEFVLLWNDISTEADCIRALERVLEKVTEPMLLGDQQVSVSASIGVTLYPEDDVDADSLLRHADHAMYTAKQLGKNRYQIFDARLERQISARFELLGMINLGLDRGQFELYYQPKVDYVAAKVVGVEALLRWNDPILGQVGPHGFLPLIENDSLAFRMGRWVMEQAVCQAKRWHQQGFDLPISINVFPRHLKYRTFIDDLRNVVAMNWPQMPKHRLLMEIVETTELEEIEPIEQVIKECVELGIGFSLDDFGTGYSSLVYLRRLSIQELKIDQSFVRDMLEDPDDEAIVIGVISLGQAFGLRVVAEGVETIRQAEHLVGLGCSVVQGYGLGRPMPVQAMEKWYLDYIDKNSKPELE
jgi:diguanylate cyclase (GGDEF)-like protein/PAS domain S-box-containing protein